MDRSITEAAVAATRPESPALTAVSPAAWQVVGAAVRGVSHERLDLPCQDAQDFRVLPDGTLLIALADGAGSARYSDEGARSAVQAALDALAALLEDNPPDEAAWEALLRSAFSAAREAVLRLPDDSAQPAGIGDDALEALPPVSVREYACTLTCVVARADRLAVGQVGDGAVVALGEPVGADEAGELFALTRVQRGEYANETHFITQVDALDQLVIEMTERPVTSLAVMSDGMIRLALKMPAQAPHAPFFQPLFRFAAAVQDAVEAEQQLSAFLTSERVNARTDDDKSLVLAVRAASYGEQAQRDEPVKVAARENADSPDRAEA